LLYNSHIVNVERLHNFNVSIYSAMSNVFIFTSVLYKNTKISPRIKMALLSNLFTQLQGFCLKY